MFCFLLVNIDISKPLCRGRAVRLGTSEKGWVDFRYECLPIFCYWCGKLDHDDRDCTLWIDSNESLELNERQKMLNSCSYRLNNIIYIFTLPVTVGNSHTRPYTSPEFSASRARTPRAATLRHEPLVSLSRAHAHHTPVPTCPMRLLRFAYCHINPKVTSHCHVNTRQPLTLTIVKKFQQDLSCSVFRVDSDFELHFYI